MNDENFDVHEAEEANEDEKEEDVMEPAEVLALPDGLDVADAEEAPADGELPTRAEAPSGSIDVRGLGTESFPGRAGERPAGARTGSTRLPAIPPELWERRSSKQKRDAVAEYEASLMASPAAMAARHASGVPALTREVDEGG